jgi:hypothetical protein
VNHNRKVRRKDDLSIESCLACEHPKELHRDGTGACYADPQKNNAPSGEGSYPLAQIDVRKDWGIGCWCRAWCDNPKQASEEIFYHGPYTLLRQGITDAIERCDSDSARRLRRRWLRETPQLNRDDLWYRYFRDNQSELSRFYAEQSREFSALKQQKPATWNRLRLEFDRLADAELKRYPHNEEVVVSIIRPQRSWLCAYAYDGEGEHFGREFYRISGGADERLKGAFYLAATEAGIALGLKGSKNALDSWIAFVFFYCREHKSKLLVSWWQLQDLREIFCEPEISHPPLVGFPVGGYPYSATLIIASICQASAVACYHLERQALERLSAPAPSAPKKSKPFEPPSLHDTQIYSVILQEKTGVAYVSELKKLKVQPSDDAEWNEWPDDYHTAYMNDKTKDWKKLISSERWRVKRRVENYLRLSGKSWEDLKRHWKI